MASETLNSHCKPSSSALNSSKLHSVSVTKPSPPPLPHPDHPNRLQSMFCSVPATAKPSKWLHRLRASRGFPESDHIDLEDFLSSSGEKIDPADSALSHERPLPEESFVAKKCEGAVQGRDLINNVLSELFNMEEFEGKYRTKRIKSCRKQHCPRVCVVSTDLDVQNVMARKNRFSSPSPLPLSLSDGHKVKEVNQITEHLENEEEKGRWDLSAYSQTEVTVIDTSVPCWKFEKILYRSKNLWKVGDTKSKGLRSGDRKKKKERLNGNGGDLQKKKLKKKMKLCNSSKSDQGHYQGKIVATNEKKWDDCSQVQEKSFYKKQIDEGPSVILIKSIPTTHKKNVSSISNNGAKSMQR